MVMDDKPDVTFVHGIDRTGIVDLVIADHNAVRELLAEYKRLMQPSLPQLAEWGAREPEQSDAELGDKKQRVAWEVIRKLSVLSVKEELVMYPALRERVGKQVAEGGLMEHHQLKVLLQELDGMHATDEGFDALMLRLVDEATCHMDAEEQEVLPLLKGHEGDLELIELGRKFNNAAHMAPTRPHPGAPTSSAALAGIAAVAAKPVDAIKDAIRFHGKA